MGATPWQSSERPSPQEPDAPLVLGPTLEQDSGFQTLVAAAAAMVAERRRIEEELQRSRRRAIAAGDLERRRIERDLHDGAQQWLVALRVKLGSAQDLCEREHSEAAGILAELDAELETAIDELREVATAIHPHLLADLGLAGALRSAARRSASPVTVSAGGIGRYDPEVEAAVYCCCLEALHNACTHAGPGVPVSIRLWQESGLLCFEVSDRGCGFDPGGVSQGMGLRNMADRIAAVGGAISIDSAPGGTTVRGAVPSAERADEET